VPRRARLVPAEHLQGEQPGQPGKIELKGEPIDLGRIALDTYAVGAEKDHIVPWDAAWRITQLFGGKVRYVLASSGHIAGIINPPGGKGTYWTNEADPPPPTPRSGARARRATTELVDGLDGLARGAVGRKGQAAGDGQRRAPADRGRARDLRAREVGGAGRRG
jgi:polyhydroxyalkanoate synthase